MLPDFAEYIRVLPWPDAVIDERGHDPRSIYVEWYWLSVLGPSTVWLLRRFAAAFEHEPAGFDLDVAECAAALGLAGGNGRNATFVRTLHRACQFHLAQRLDTSTLQVRTHIPPLTRSQVLRLPSSLRESHDRWIEHELRQHRAARSHPSYLGDEVA